MPTMQALYDHMTAAFTQAAGLPVADGGELSLRFWALAAELYALYHHIDWVSEQCFPQTAVGASLDKHAAMRGLARRQPVAATGIMRFGLSAPAPGDVAVPTGTVCLSAAQVRYVTTAEGSIPAGELTVEVPARAEVAGVGGNLPVGVIHSMALPPVSVAWCVNTTAFSGGQGEEGDDALRRRVLETYARLPNGANAAYYESTALSIVGVGAAKAIPRARGRGTVDVIVTTPTGAPPPSALLDEVGDTLQRAREIAVDVLVRAPSLHTVDLSLQIQPEHAEQYEPVAARCESALRAYFTGGLLAQPLLCSRLYRVLDGVAGLMNYHFLSPSGDVAGQDDQLIRLGELTVARLT